MGAQDRIKLGEDGIYRLVEEDASEPDDAVEEDAAPSAADSGDVAGAGNVVHDPHVLTTISSSMSGPGIGDEVAARRASLLFAKGEPQIGRREAPEPYDPRPKRIMYAKGMAAGLIVVIAVVAMLVVIGSGSSIG